MASPVHYTQDHHENNETEPIIDQSEHGFSFNSTQHTFYCYTTFKSEHFNIKCPAIFDTGSTCTIIPHNFFKTEDLSKLEKTDIKIKR